MKHPLLILASGLLTNGLLAQKMIPMDPDCCGNQPSDQIQVRAYPNAQTIEAKRKAANAKAYARSQARLVPEEVLINDRSKGFIANSSFVVGHHGFVILPKGAVATLGRGIQEMETPPQNKKLLEWADFVRLHRGQVIKVEVSPQMLNGNQVELTQLQTQIEKARSNGLTQITTLSGTPVSLPKIKSPTAKL